MRSSSAASLAAPASSGWSYAARALLHPTGVAFLIVGVWVGAWLGGATGAALGFFGSSISSVWAAQLLWIRRLLDSHQAERDRRQRVLERERRLRRAGPLRRAEFGEISALVGDLETHHAAQAERYELQALLDSYIDLAVLHQRMAEAVQRAARAPLLEPAPRGVDLAATARHRKDILSRRIQHRDQCRIHAARLSDELDAIAEFVHLVSEVTICPINDSAGEQELERRLWELEAHESALRQLTAA